MQLFIEGDLIYWENVLDNKGTEEITSIILIRSICDQKGPFLVKSVITEPGGYHPQRLSIVNALDQEVTIAGEKYISGCYFSKIDRRSQLDELLQSNQ